MTFLFQWGLPVTFGAAAIALWFFAGHIPVIGKDLRRWLIVGLVAAAAVSAIYGRGRSAGENSANLKTERQNNAAAKGSDDLRTRNRDCRARGMRLDTATGNCVGTDAGRP